MKKRTEETEVLLDLDDDSKKDVPGAPFDIRPQVLNITNCIVGVSVLAMPYCFQQCGILLAVAMIAISSVITKLTCHFLFLGATNVRVRSYEALAAAAFGHKGRRIVEVLLLFFLMSSMVAYLVVIGDLGPHILADYLELAAPTERLRVLVMVVVMLFVIIPLSTIKDLEVFSVVSSVAVIFYAIFVLHIFIESVESFIEGTWSLNVVWWRPEGFLACLPIVTMALACQTQLFSVTESLPNPTIDQVDSVVSAAVNLCSAMYAAVGLFGYVAFYSRQLHGDVLVELTPTVFTQLLKLAFMLSVAVSVPLMLFPARHALFNLCLRPNGCELPMASIQRSTFHILTIIILIVNLLVAILIPNVEFILGLTGSLIGSLITIIFPSILFIKVARSAQQSTVPFAKICLIIGVFLLVACTFVTLTKEQKSNLAARPEPKEKLPGDDVPAEVKALEHLEKLEEKVLDTNMNISQKLSDISELAAQGKQIEAKDVIEEIKQQREEQRELLEKQEKIVDQLNKHMEDHEKLRSEEREREKIDKRAEPVLPEKGAEPSGKKDTVDEKLQPIDRKDTVVRRPVPIDKRDTVDTRAVGNESVKQQPAVVDPFVDKAPETPQVRQRIPEEPAPALHRHAAVESKPAPEMRKGPPAIRPAKKNESIQG